VVRCVWLSRGGGCVASGCVSVDDCVVGCVWFAVYGYVCVALCVCVVYVCIVAMCVCVCVCGFKWLCSHGTKSHKRSRDLSLRSNSAKNTNFGRDEWPCGGQCHCGS
jgi:hypothetical protein